MSGNNNNNTAPESRSYNQLMWSDESSTYYNMFRAIQDCLHPSPIVVAPQEPIKKNTKTCWTKGTDLAVQLLRTPTVQHEEIKQRCSLTLNLASLHAKLETKAQKKGPDVIDNSEASDAKVKPGISYSSVLRKS